MKDNFMIQTDVKEKDVDKKRRTRKYISMILIIFILLFCVWIVWGNYSLQTSVYEVKLPANEEEIEGFTIVQISDLHNAEFGKEQNRLIEEINRQEPDIIAVTGDLVDSAHTDVETAMIFMEKAVTIAPVYYITGNHEGWIEESVYEELKVQMEKLGVHILENEAEIFLYANTSMTLAGVHDPDMPGNNVVLVKNAINALMEDKQGYTILLSHRPELFDVYAESGVDLVLTGHAHGGQFRIPFIGGVVAPNQGMFPKYSEGTFTRKDTTMVVSRGLGNSVIPIRINNRPEIVVIRLTTEE